MISRITMKSGGLADYLERGKRKDSQYSRIEKDNVISLYGDIETFRNTEKYCQENKNWKNNYEHLVISFSKEDMEILNKLPPDEYKRVLNEIAMDYIKHRTSGYDVNNEVIAIAEAHEPKVKVNEKGDERLLHIHIGISYLNPMNNTKLRTAFYNNSYISDVMDKYIAKKNGLTYIEKFDDNRQKPVQKNNKKEIVTLRDKLKNDLKNIENTKQLEKYFKDNDLNFRIVKTKNNHYYKVLNPDETKKDINLNGKDFEHIAQLNNPNYKAKSKKEMIDEINSKDTKELETILHSYYEKRIDLIDNRRSKEHKKELEKIIDKDLSNDKNLNNNDIKSFKNLSFQEKIFYKHYQKNIKDFDFKGYYIDTSSNEKTTFTNIQKNIKIEDKGNEITSNTKSESLEEEVKLMIKLAEAKGWDISNLDITGSDDFKKEAEKQIAEKLKEIEKTQKVEVKKVPDFQKERPNSELQNYKKDFVEKQYQKEANVNLDLQKIKAELQAKKVLDFAIQKYKLDSSKYKLTDDNKIDNTANKQKPKNVIDFLQKEANLSTKEAIEICQDLHNEQNKNTHKKEVEKAKEIEKVKKREREGRER